MIEEPSIPDRFSILQEDYREQALDSLRKKGAVILTDVVPASEDTTWKFTAEQTPFLLFTPNDLRLSKHQASGVHVEHHGTPGEMNGKGLLPHTDGYVWGDRNPDIVILLCEQCSIEGGHNYLVDGERMIQRLQQKEEKKAEEIDEGRLLEILTKAKVDHTERLEHGFGAEGIESFVPIFRREGRRNYQDTGGGSWLDAPTPLGNEPETAIAGRLRWRRMIPLQITKETVPIDGNTYMSCWKAVEEESGDFPQEEVTKAFTILDKEIYQEMQNVPRFQLQPGECLIADNYRMLHARENYRPNSQTNKVNRRMWRVWTWTVESEGLPPGMNDERQATTVLSAGKFINENKRDGTKVN